MVTSDTLCKTTFIRRISAVSNAIQTIDNEANHLIIYCLNCIRHGRNATYEPGLTPNIGLNDIKTSVRLSFINRGLCKTCLKVHVYKKYIWPVYVVRELTKAIKTKKSDRFITSSIRPRPKNLKT